jgi:uncharacterized protein
VNGLIERAARRTGFLVLVATGVVAAAACRDRGAEKPPPVVIDLVAWRQELLDYRRETDVKMRTGATSPLAAVQREVLAAEGPTFVRVDGDAVKLSDQSDGAGASVVFRPGPERWSWEALAPGITAVNAGRRDPSPPGPIMGPMDIALGRFTLWVQPVEKTFVVMVYDPEAAGMKGFPTLSYFEPDPRYAVAATIERSSEAVAVTMPTSIGLKKTFMRYGTLRFSIDGKVNQLTAYKPVGVDGTLFVPFRDTTSGKATYGGGRYLDLDEPDGDQRTILVDFNRAYNPMCCFSAVFNCPIPPVENHLAVAIEAGEKTYPH